MTSEGTVSKETDVRQDNESLLSWASVYGALLIHGLPAS